MTNEMIAAALDQALTYEIAECEKLPDHKFSHRFDQKMKKLLQGGIGDNNNTSRLRIGKRLLVAIVIVGSLLLLMGAAVTAYVLWGNFHLRDMGTYTLFNMTDIENCPYFIEEYYEIIADLSGFTEDIISDDKITFLVEYKNKENNVKISFLQQIKHGFTMALNTEDTDQPIEVTVNGCNSIYYQTKYGSHVLIWDTGDYLLELGAYGVSKNELFLLAEYVQKVE